MVNGARACRNGGQPSSRERAAAGGPAGRAGGCGRTGRAAAGEPDRRMRRPIFKTIVLYYHLFQYIYEKHFFNI